ncbi:Uncharacterised protein [Collinsella intestinalis]|nr:Uncharacterised protein [Collinsella intestinalis]
MCTEPTMLVGSPACGFPRMTNTSSASVSASSMSWVTMSAVVPMRSATSRNHVCMSALVKASSAENGSSSSMNSCENR